METSNDFGLQLKQARTAACLSLRALALTSGVSAATLSRLERGKPVDAASLFATARALGLRVRVEPEAGAPVHYIASVCGHTSKEWHRVGTAVKMPDEDFVRVHIPLGAKTIFLHPCTSEEAAPDGVPLPRSAP